MAKQRINEDRVLTQFEINRRHQAKIAAIDDILDKAIAEIDWEKRNRGGKSFLDFILTFCVGLFLDNAPSGKMIDVINQLEKSLETDTPTQLEIPRGQGKTAISILFLIWVLLYNPNHKFAMIVSQNARQSQGILKEITRFFLEPETDFSRCFPEIHVPLTTNSNGKKLQTYRSLDTAIERNAQQIILPRIVKDDGTEYNTSGSVIAARPITAVRGSRAGRKGYRPSIILIDDVQKSSDAESPIQVDKLLQLILKDISGLSAQGKKLKMIMTATKIAADDLCEQIENNISWKTVKYKAIISYPTDMIKNPDEGYWHKYFTIFDEETISGEGHNKSLEFYRSNFNVMNEGAETFNDFYDEADGHISALQKFLEKRHLIGKGAFDAEYQMTPVKNKFAVEISPNRIISKTNEFQPLEIPSEYRYITYGIDINSSYAISVVGIAWRVDTTGIVFYHNTFGCHIDQKLPDTAYNQALYNVLTDVCNKIKALGIKPNAVAIDCGGRQWDAVTLFARQYHALPICAFAGRSSTQFQSCMFSRVRLKDAIGRTVLCGDDAERAKSGSGRKYVYFDADFCKHSIQTAINCIVGDVGSLSLYKSTKEDHTEFCIQLANERIISIIHKQNGLDVYSWKSKEPHDFLDCCAMCRAALSQLGITSTNFSTKEINRQKKIKFFRRNKYRIV